jgi:hypothetical protein
MALSTNRIRIELTFGALTLRELAERCGVTGKGATEKVIPFVWQMEHRTKEVVAIKGNPKRYRLKRQHTALETW